MSDTITCFQQYDLLYIEANRSYSILHFEGNKTIKISKPMAWIMAKIEEWLLIKCHKSFVVNRLKIKSVDSLNPKIYLINGITVPISCRELSNVLKIINN